jgi:hypothetical protein
MRFAPLVAVLLVLAASAPSELALAKRPPPPPSLPTGTVVVTDLGVKTRCAEEDNVYASVAAPGVRRFEVEARHPAYGKDLKADNAKADFTDCHPNGAKDFKFTPRTRVLYEDADVKFVGVTYGGYWRPDVVDVQVDGVTDSGFHLLQLFIKHGDDVQEALVLHAADGYWRLRPLPLPQFGGAVYGSSFLVGPVEETTRPFVRIRKVTIDPRALGFHLDYVKGGSADLKVAKVDHEALRMTVSLDPPVKNGPFLALRSMYVADDNADTAELRVTGPHGRTLPSVGFGQVQATAIRFGRSVVSRHNTSAPDMTFEKFER